MRVKVVDVVDEGKIASRSILTFDTAVIAYPWIAEVPTVGVVVSAKYRLYQVDPSETSTLIQSLKVELAVSLRRNAASNDRRVTLVP